MHVAATVNAQDDLVEIQQNKEALLHILQNDLGTKYERTVRYFLPFPSLASPSLLVHLSTMFFFKGDIGCS